MNTKHTPGPWVIDGDCIVGGLRNKEYDGVEGRIVADINPATQYLKSPVDERLPNARLIAAAPELLEALQIAHNAIIGNDAFLSQPEWEKIESAIKKATE